MIKFNPVLFREWFSGWEEVDDPVTMLQRVWVLENIAADEKRERAEKDDKFDLILRFLDGELYKQYDGVRTGKSPGVKASEENAESSAFFKEVEELPSKRVSKPPLKEDYVAKRMQELADKLARRGIEVEGPAVEPPKPGEKKFVVERKIIRRNG